jgi:hypothetical protein
MQARVRDLSSSTQPPIDFASAVRLRHWLQKAASEPARCYELAFEAGRVTFALGAGVAGGVAVEMDSGSRQLVEGDRAAPPVVVDERRLAGATLIPLDRLVEVIVALAEKNRRLRGKWMPLDQFPDEPAAAAVAVPQARGLYSAALVRWVERTPARKAPLAEVLALLPLTSDEGVRAYLHACAHREPQKKPLQLADFQLEPPRAEPDGGGGVRLGALATGEPIVARPDGTVVLAASGGWSARGLEGFLVRQLGRARELGEQTALDHLI